MSLFILWKFSFKLAVREMRIGQIHKFCFLFFIGYNQKKIKFMAMLDGDSDTHGK